MKADRQKIKRNLKLCEFTKIFTQELGWDNLREAPITITYKHQDYKFIPLAHKKKFKIYLHTFSGRIPEAQILKQLDLLLNSSAAAHLTIFVDAQRENQAWLWVKRVGEGTKGRSVPRLHRYNINQNGESLVQKIEKLFISLDDEEHLTLTSVLDRVMQGFDVEKVTKTFYEGFKKEHDNFLKNIENIPSDEEDDLKWYASIMLNRLMFVYFLQKKKVLDNRSAVKFDGDEDYLENRLIQVREDCGKDNFYAFYRYFLRSLFHDGLNRPESEHTPELEKIIGRVPHINGGIFDVHALERKYPDIRIKDEVFERLFEFFNTFHWHLDDRPMRDDSEINPDVLGYIFEKYINQKQMGAYYTKEDITEYISKNTIIPFIFEKVAQSFSDDFMPDGPIWSLLKDTPDAYIYDEMAHGILELLPSEIEAGISDIAQRTLWNQPADEQWALPTETWREVVERRRRYSEVHAKITSGEISTINDLITYNLNITQFAEDVIARCKKPGLLNAFYKTIEQASVLDPTCGSGAFLFAALNILKPLYQACIERMRFLVKEQTSLPASQRKECDHIASFQDVIKHVDQHASQEYFILKSIIINNIYGVDIMEEAIEICKLRLFLKLVAQVERPQDLEPLPDIDFNVLAGNTLVGFTSLDEIRRVVTTKLLNVGDTEKTLQLIERDVQQIERDEHNFRHTQTDRNLKIDPAAKEQLRNKLEALRDKLDPYLATEYGIYASKYHDKDEYAKAYAQWKRSHKPFHWWAEFYKIMQNGGFDVIIGNPPYVEYIKVKKSYEIRNYQTENCGNLYALSVERMESLSKGIGVIGVIIPVASISTDGLWCTPKSRHKRVENKRELSHLRNLR